jgi:ABC-2 type transport system permease protein
MLQNASGSLTSTKQALQATRATWLGTMREHLVSNGAGGYVLVWVAFPFFTLAAAGLIYRSYRPSLLGYVVVGITASTLITNALFHVGQMLDEQRIYGTLTSLFLAPCPRVSWLTGLAFGGLFETGVSALAVLLFGTVAFGVRFDPDYPALVLSVLLFIVSLWGMGLIFASFGLILRRSNDLANLLSSVIVLLGGVYYPVALLPVWLRYPARCLPLGYGIQAMASSSLHHAGITQLSSELVPLAGFAVATPALGLLTFAWLERKVRQRGEIDLY